MAKTNLQSPDDTLYSLMDNVNDFLVGDGQAMLVLGNSGARRTTFNRYLEHHHWQEYIIGVSIPLAINLPALERSEKDLVPEQLRTFALTEEQILEFKQERQFVLKDEGFAMNATNFQQDLATPIVTHQDGRPIVDYIHSRDKPS